LIRELVVCTAVVFASCAAHVASAIQIDGAPFAASTCRSGQANGFSGVELADQTGRRLRLAHNLNGTLAAVYFPPGRQVGVDLGGCFTMTTKAGVGVINGVRNIEGGAVLECRTETLHVSGSVQFENCH
jgi:hypothetical protein